MVKWVTGATFAGILALIVRSSCRGYIKRSDVLRGIAGAGNIAARTGLSRLDPSSGCAAASPEPGTGARSTCSGRRRFVSSVSRPEGKDRLVRVTRWGNSLAVRIPKHLAEQTNITEGSEVELGVADGAVTVRPKARSYTLQELLDQVTPENRHDELDWGEPQGREIW